MEQLICALLANQSNILLAFVFYWVICEEGQSGGARETERGKGAWLWEGTPWQKQSKSFRRWHTKSISCWLAPKSISVWLTCQSCSHKNKTKMFKMAAHYAANRIRNALAGKKKESLANGSKHTAAEPEFEGNILKQIQAVYIKVYHKFCCWDKWFLASLIKSVNK